MLDFLLSLGAILDRPLPPVPQPLLTANDNEAASLPSADPATALPPAVADCCRADIGREPAPNEAPVPATITR